jgi:hypothetical protein
MKDSILEDRKDRYQEGKLDSLIKSNSILNKMEIRDQRDSNSQMKSSALEDRKDRY